MPIYADYSEAPPRVLGNTTSMVTTRVVLAASLAGMIALSAPLRAAEPTLQDRQAAACYDDAMRLCGQFVPDADAVKTCMKPKKKLVSAACAAFYPASR